MNVDGFERTAGRTGATIAKGKAAWKVIQAASVFLFYNWQVGYKVGGESKWLILCDGSLRLQTGGVEVRGFFGLQGERVGVIEIFGKEVLPSDAE